MPCLTLITPTSDRPEGIALTKRWLLSQVLTRPTEVQWIVCDDGQTKADVADIVYAQPKVNPNLRLTVEHVRIPPAASTSESFRQNVSAGICRAEYDRLAFWEDDDFYPPTWLEWVSRQFDAGIELIGEGHARYYHVGQRRYRTLPNAAHASLCQTAVSRRLAGWIDHRCRTRTTAFVDFELWRRGPRCERYLQTWSTVVGIKGLPGKRGIGIGHTATLPRCDRSLIQLRQWAGDEAVEAYARFYVGTEGNEGNEGRRAA